MAKDAVSKMSKFDGLAWSRLQKGKFSPAKKNHRFSLQLTSENGYVFYTQQCGEWEIRQSDHESLESTSLIASGGNPSLYFGFQIFEMLKNGQLI